jgi:parvulin-like peptidyl-prolyl isomerase
MNPRARFVVPISLLALVSACASAAPNPKRPTQPSTWQPDGKAAAKPNAPSADGAPTPAAQPKGDAAASAALAADSVAKDATAKDPAAKDTAKPAGAAIENEPVVANVAGRPVYMSELLVQWMYSDSLQVLQQLDDLALGRLFVAEGTRLGVKIAPDLVTETSDRIVKAMEAEIARKNSQNQRQGMTLDKYVDTVLGLDPIRYRERLRDDALRQLLGERVMRAWLLAQPHATIRIIVVGSEEDMKSTQADLTAGTAFDEVARKHSMDPSSKDGGSITPIVKADTALGKLAFETNVGAVGGPIHEAGRWLFLKVEERPDPIVGDWSVLGPAVEKNLEARPVDTLEVKQWKTAMLQRYEVSFQPFLRLVGQGSN